MACFDPGPVGHAVYRGAIIKKGGQSCKGVLIDLFEAIRTRRSIRSFTDEPVSQEGMDHMLGDSHVCPQCQQSPALAFSS